MKIKYAGKEDKKAQATSGEIYVFDKSNDFTCDVKEKELAEHLIKKCGDRFVAIGEEIPQEEPEAAEEPKVTVKKKKGGRKKR